MDALPHTPDRTPAITPTGRSGTAAPWCRGCPLRLLSDFEDFAPADLAFLDGFKIGHGHAWAGETLIRQGESRPRLMTLFAGWAARYRTLHSGERQLLTILLPGELIGLETLLSDVPRHSVEALTDVTFCQLDARRFDEFVARPALARRLARYQMMDQRRVERRMTAVGACDARRAMADLIHDLYDRMSKRRRIRGASFRLPLTRRQLAEALGLTSVHVYRTLRGLNQEGIMSLSEGRIHIHDPERLREAACVTDLPAERLPII